MLIRLCLILVLLFGQRFKQLKKTRYYNHYSRRNFKSRYINFEGNMIFLGDMIFHYL